MRGTKSVIYLHFVWATYERQPFVTADVERAIYRCIENETRRLQCHVLAIGGMPDHIHLFVKMSTRISAARLMQQAKSVSSTFVRQTLRPNSFFNWQDGYGVFSVSPAHKRRILNYVQNQKHHHATNALIPNAEEVDAEWEPDDTDAP